MLNLLISEEGLEAQHHEEVYPSLKVDSLKRVMMERCLPENIKEKIWSRQTMEDVYYGGIWAMHSWDQAKHTMKMSEEVAAALEEMEQGGNLTAVQ